MQIGYKNLNGLQATAGEIDASVAINSFASNEVPVLIILGQSNADGRASANDISVIKSYDFSDGSVKIYNKPITRFPSDKTINRKFNGSFQNIAIGNSAVVSPVDSFGFGVEIPIAKIWKDEVFCKSKTSLYIIKLAVGGTSLGAISNAVDTDWTDSSDQLRNLAVDFVIKPAIDSILASGLKPRLLGIIWGQGESDATSTLAPAYEANLSSFIDDIRFKTGFSDARFLIMQLSNYANTTEWNTIKTAQENICRTKSNCILVNTDGNDGVLVSRFANGVGAGDIHYNSIGISTLAYKYFDQLDYYGAEYNSPYYVNITEINAGDPSVLKNFTQGGINGLFGFCPYLTTGGYKNLLTCFNDAEYTVRTVGDSQPSPFLKLNKQLGNFEFDFKLANSHAKGGFFIRASYTNNYSGYFIQFRKQDSQIRLYKVVAGTFTLIASSAMSALENKLARYRIIANGTNIKLYYYSDDISMDTLLINVDDPTYDSGHLYYSIYVGLPASSSGNISYYGIGIGDATIYEL